MGGLKKMNQLQAIVSSQVKRESNQLYGLKVMRILQLSKCMVIVQCDKMKYGSPKPQVQGKGWYQGEEIPDDESTVEWSRSGWRL